MTVSRLVAVLVTGVIVLAGCGENGATPPATPGASPPSVTAEPQLPPPDGFPDSLPPPPQDATIVHTELSENPVMNPEYTERLGTTIDRTVWYEYRDGAGPSVDEIAEHYRTELPTAGWTIHEDEELDHEDRYAPGYRLGLDGNGFWRAELLILTEDERIQVRASVSEQFEEPPSPGDPPLVPMPDWYAAILEPPPDVQRQRIWITGSLDRPDSHVIEYSDFHETATDEGRVAVLIDYYRDALPAAGWVVVDEEDATEDIEVEHGQLQRRQIELRIEGHNVGGRVNAFQESDITGSWQTAHLSITIDHQA